MSLRRRLSFRSTLLFTCTMLFVTVGSYLLSRYFIERSYRQELLRVARLSAMFYLERDELNSRTNQRIEQEFKKISDVSVKLYQPGDSIVLDDSTRLERSDEIVDETIKDGSLFFDVGDRSVLTFYYQDNEGNFIIVVSGRDDSGIEQVRILGEMLVLFGLLGWGLHLGFTLLLARKTFEPFETLITQVRSIQGNDWHARLNLPRRKNDEIKKLIDEFNHLLERIEYSVLVQRNFLRNASHEIKTPLAIIVGDIEVSLNSDRSTAEYVDVLSSLKKNALHLRSVIESLTTLSDLEVAGADLNVQFRIDEVIWDVVQKKKIEYPHRQVNVTFDGGSDSSEHILMVRANRALIQIAISNIVDNALKYSEGDVDIILHATHSPLSIEVVDSGVGIASEELTKIFDIFYRAAATRHIQGHGIGLYLSRQILALHSGQISVTSTPGKGTAFTLVFP